MHAHHTVLSHIIPPTAHLFLFPPPPPPLHLSQNPQIPISRVCVRARAKSSAMGVVVEEGYTYEEESHLTVMKTSVFFSGDGFTAHDSHGHLVFRVDTYGGPDTRDHRELVLMDSTGHSLLTLRRKRPSLHQRWEGFAGEGEEGSKPIFSVRRSSMIGRSDVTVEVFGVPGGEYLIEGSFGKRCCTVYDAGDRSVVAEIRRKVDCTTNVVLGKDVFVLCVKPGFDSAFAMGLVLVLDQIGGDGDSDDDELEALQSDDSHREDSHKRG